MRLKLFTFFMLIIFFCVIITEFLSYIFMKSWILNNTDNNLKSETELINQFAYQNYKLIFIATFIGVLIFGIIVFYYLKHFIRPINDLTTMATAMATGGSYENKIHVSTMDEVGQLGKAFNLLSERLHETISDLADKENKLISILTSMDDGVVVLDKYERILLINPVAERLFNINYNATGRYFIETIRNNDFNDIIKNIPNEDVELTIKSSVVRNLRIRTTSVVNYDKTNEQLGLLMVIQDITKIKTLEKMRTDFVANVSHELKTPLTSIKGFAETLKFVKDKATKDKFLDIIYVESERLTRLINDILTLSEIENKDFLENAQRININESIQDVVYIMEHVARSKNIHLNYDFKSTEEDLFINGDNDKFKQMIINLVDNAIKYTNSEGTVNIQIVQDGIEAKISIQDNGIGISEEHISRLFERFYRVDKARSRSIGGTGLGLAIVKHIVILLNGRIHTISELGIGTEFTIYLPLSE